MILELLHDVCKRLNEKNIRYMVSGSIALNIYTIPRMTRDIDIVIDLPLNRIDEFVTLFSEFYIDKDIIIHEVKSRGMFNVIDIKSGFKIDFIIYKGSKYDELAFKRRQKIREFNTDICVIDINDLIIAKLIWIQDYQSERQMHDIKGLLLNPEIDVKYLQKWCLRLNLQTFGLINNE